ncbi:MAG: hypothetical protein E7561_05670 [Ruminococcaceae bacterium]|nr:hypothetical protein [Oscillospiraceae bacterium]
MRKLLSLVLSVALLLSFAVIPVSADNTDTELQSDITATSNNSFGGLVSETINAQLEKQLENNGFNVFSIEYLNGVATVELEALEDCTLLVGVYSEDGKTLHTSATVSVTTNEKTVDVNLDTAGIPDYFLISAYLINTEDFKPLCTVYTTYNYTKEMIEFLSKTTEDFQEDKVLKLEDDNTNNFAVYNDSVTMVDENSETTVSEENGVYTITNATTEISNLKKDDIFSYNYQNGDALILKVADISVSGSTVTITEGELNLQDAFDYVKIDTTESGTVAEVDDTELPNGITYEGTSEPPATYGLDVGTSVTVAYNYELNEYELGKENDSDTSQINATISGSVNVAITAGVKLYVATTNVSVEVKFDYDVNFGVSVEGEAKGYIPLGRYTFAPVPGVYIELNPSIASEFSGAITLSAGLSGSVGFSAGLKGVKNLTTTPKIEAGVQIEASVFLGISLEPKIKIISKKIAETSLTATVGGEIAARLEYKASSEKDTTKKHTCNVCLDGEFYGKLNVKFQIKLLNWDKLTFKFNMLDLKLKLTDFYYSVDNNKFGLGNCEYIGYKTTVSVKNENNKAMKAATLTVDGKREKLNAKGVATVYLTNGEHKITAKSKGFLSTTKKIEIENGVSTVALKLKKSPLSSKIDTSKFDINRHAGLIDDDGTLYTFGDCQWGILGDGGEHSSQNVPPQAILDDVKSIQIVDLDNAAITKNDDLYMWGMNHTGGCGKEGMLVNKPNKVMSNVKTVSFYEYNTAIVTKDGGLYTLGSGHNSMLGDGFSGNRHTPVKIMDNVALAKVYSHKAAAIKENGDFYMWGLFREELGMTISMPTKFLENAADVIFGDTQTFVITKNGDLYSLGWYSGRNWSDGFDKVMGNVKSVYTKDGSTYVITKDKELYAFGYNYYGTLGDGSTDNQTTPVKIMDNVEYVSAGYLSAYAIKSNGDLYSWGDNNYSQLGNGNNIAQNKPQKIMSNVAFVDNGANVTTAITEDGSIYVWGEYIKPFLSQDITKSNYPVKVDYFDTATYSLRRSVGGTYTDLIPNFTYNYYVVDTDIITNNLNNQNLKFAGQATSDESGQLFLPDEVSAMVSSGKKLILREYARLNGNIEYLISQNGNAIVTGVNAEDTVTIPKTVGDYNVTAIANTAFEYTPNMTDITMNDGIKEIANGTFSGLQNVILHGECVEDNTYFKAFAETEGIEFSETHKFLEATLLSAPTSEAEGSISHTCENCNITEILALPLVKITPAILHSGGKFTVQFKIPAKVFDGSGYGELATTLDGLEVDIDESGEWYTITASGDGKTEHTLDIWVMAAGRNFGEQITTSVTKIADLNGDTKLNVLDFINSQKAVDNMGSADLDGDGLTNANDMVLMKKLLLFN